MPVGDDAVPLGEDAVPVRAAVGGPFPVRWRDTVAVVDREGRRRTSYGELDDLADRVAAAWRADGLRPGDRVGLFLPNCVELVVGFLAAFRAGLVAVPVNTRYEGAQVRYVLDRAGAAAVVVHRRFAGRLPADDARPQWVVGPDTDTWRDLPVAVRPPEPRPADRPAVLLFTSGTTGHPKGVTHTLGSVTASVEQLVAQRRFTAGERLLVSLAFCHVAGLLGQVLPGLAVGATLVLHDGFRADAVAAEIDRAAVTRLELLPGQLAELVDRLEAAPPSARPLRGCVAGGDAVPVDVQARFEALTGCRVSQVCGMTECFDYAMTPLTGPTRPGSVGVPAPGTTIQVRDGSGAVLGPDEVGELWVRGPSVMAGYWDDPAATAETLVDGWLATGDLGRLDGDGWLWFVGRRKQIIVRGGSNISPAEVEAALLAAPGVVAAVVVGVPDRRLGQRVAAFLVPRGPGAIDLDAVRRTLQGRLAEYQRPEWLWTVDELPTNPVGKPDRVALAALAQHRTR
ncbi:class I adenylate-forming enzyme family protein [Nakamurella endophytica]|uniref:class I adenylate-forming enzyme family protein n=1 Tax=Nakamurella endophytica TaxID=1748367 RepID=UPI001E523EEB|nr:class I adenylate-forming enzyme family protein [Nakamurella endophytica]